MEDTLEPDTASIAVRPAEENFHENFGSKRRPPRAPAVAQSLQAVRVQNFQERRFECGLNAAPVATLSELDF